MVRTYRFSCSLPSSACHPHQISVLKARVRQQQWKLPRGPCFVRPTTSRPIPSIILQATDQKQEQGQVKEEEIVDNKILPYCSINKKEQKRTVGELEQDFLEALQSFYFENKPIMTNEEFDNLKEELMWEGSSVVMLSKDEQKFMEASLAYNAGKPIMNDAQYDELKLNLKKAGSKVAIEGPRCSLRSRNVYSDLTVDYFKMFLLNVPAAIVALSLVFFLDDLTGFEITYLLELPEPYSFIVTWFLVLPATYLIAQTITNVILKDFLILKGPCPNCGRENVSFYGTILTVPSGGPVNQVKCENCGTMMLYNSETRLITLAPNKQEGSKKIPQLEAKNRAMDRDFNANQGKVTMMEAKMSNLEKLIKQIAENVSTLLKKLEMDKGEDSPQAVDSQGPSKRTRAHSKKIEDTGKKDEVKAVAENMQILADQALDLIKAT